MSKDGSRRPRVLVVKLSSLGDLVHALPVVHELKQAYKADITWVTQPGFRALVEKFPDVDHVLAFPRDRFWTGYPAFLRRLRSVHYDLVVDLQGLLKSALLVGRAARAAHRVGVPARREGASMFYEASARDGGPHAVDRLLGVLNVLDLKVPADPVFNLAFPKAPFPEERPRIAVVPCSRWPAKDWPVENFIAVCRGLQEERDVAVYLVGVPADAAVCREIHDALPGRTVNLCGKTGLPELGSMLAGMDLVLSVDSGPMHLAAALGVPVLALFGVTDPRRTGPYGKRCSVLMADEFRDHPQLPRIYRRSELAGRWTIPVEKVIEQALQMLA